MFPVGTDVSKSTLALCMLYDGIKGRVKTPHVENRTASAESEVLHVSPGRENS